MKKIVLGFFLLSFVGCSGWKSDLSSNGNGQFEDRKIQDLESLSANSVRILEKPNRLQAEEGQRVEFNVRVKFFGSGEITESRIESEQLAASFEDLNITAIDAENFKVSFTVPLDFIAFNKRIEEQEFGFVWKGLLKMKGANDTAPLSTESSFQLAIEKSKKLWTFEKALIDKRQAKERSPIQFFIWMKAPGPDTLALVAPFLKVEPIASANVVDLKLPVDAIVRVQGNPRPVAGRPDILQYVFEIFSPFDLVKVDKAKLEFNIVQQSQFDPALRSIAFSTDSLLNDPIYVVNVFSQPVSTLRPSVDVVRTENTAIRFNVYDPKEEGQIKVEFLSPACNRPDSGVTCTCSYFSFNAECLVSIKANSLQTNTWALDFKATQYSAKDPTLTNSTKFVTTLQVK